MSWFRSSATPEQSLVDAEAAYSRGDYDEAANTLDAIIAAQYADDHPGDNQIKRATGLMAKVERARDNPVAAAYWLIKAGPDAGAEAIALVAKTKLDGGPPGPGVIDYCIQGFRLLRPEEADHAAQITDGLRRWLRPTLSLKPRFGEWRERNQALSEGAFAPGWSFFHLAMLAAAEGDWDDCEILALWICRGPLPGRARRRGVDASRTHRRQGNTARAFVAFNHRLQPWRCINPATK